MELDAVLNSIGECLREERIHAGLTLDQLAKRAELSTAHLSRLESGDRQPSVAALITLSRALGTSVSRLLGEGRGDSPLALFTSDIPSPMINGLAVAGCSGFPGSSTLEALRISIDPDRIPPAYARHRGEEWIFVIDGVLRLEYGEDVHILEPGSSAHFEADRPHRLGAQGAVTEVVVVAADAPVDLKRHPLFSTSNPAH